MERDGRLTEFFWKDYYIRGGTRRQTDRKISERLLHKRAVTYRHGSRWKRPLNMVLCLKRHAIDGTKTIYVRGRKEKKEKNLENSVSVPVLRCAGCGVAVLLLQCSFELRLVLGVFGKTVYAFLCSCFFFFSITKLHVMCSCVCVGKSLFRDSICLSWCSYICS